MSRLKYDMFRYQIFKSRHQETINDQFWFKLFKKDIH
jgi:hypothetical protein